jgi:hypothetical protein
MHPGGESRKTLQLSPRTRLPHYLLQDPRALRPGCHAIHLRSRQFCLPPIGRHQVACFPSFLSQFSVVNCCDTSHILTVATGPHRASNGFSWIQKAVWPTQVPSHRTLWWRLRCCDVSCAFSCAFVCSVMPFPLLCRSCVCFCSW